MIEKEITHAKQCALTTRDWDTYQIIVRTCLTAGKTSPDLLVSQKQADSLAAVSDSLLPMQKRR